MRRTCLIAGSLLALIAVAAGAFGAHALANLPERFLNAFKTGAQYQMYHALGLLVLGLLLPRARGSVDEPDPAPRAGRTPVAAVIAAWSFLIGTLLFSGSLYALALTQLGAFGAITPIGGVLFLVGWAALAVHATRA